MGPAVRVEEEGWRTQPPTTPLTIRGRVVAVVELVDVAEEVALEVKQVAIPSLS